MRVVLKSASGKVGLGTIERGFNFAIGCWYVDNGRSMLRLPDDDVKLTFEILHAFGERFELIPPGEKGDRHNRQPFSCDGDPVHWTVFFYDDHDA